MFKTTKKLLFLKNAIEEQETIIATATPGSNRLKTSKRRLQKYSTELAKLRKAMASKKLVGVAV